MQNLLKHKYAKLVISAAVVVFGVIFMLLTAPKPTMKPAAPAANVNSNANTAINANANVPVTTNTNKPKAVVKKPTPKVISFTEKKTAHFVSSSVANNATLTQMPETITVSFDTSISASTQVLMTVKKDDTTMVTRGQSYIGSDRKTISVNLNQTVTGGDFYVYYVACFADTGCKDGRFGFHLKLP